jgi:hypothetical protein
MCCMLGDIVLTPHSKQKSNDIKCLPKWNQEQIQLQVQARVPENIFKIAGTEQLHIFKWYGR